MAKAQWIALESFVDTALRGYNPAEAAPRTESLSGPIYSRYIREREPLKVAESVKGAALAAVEGLKFRVAELKDALAQIDRALTAAKVSTLRPATEPSRRKAATVEFDNISMPREAVS